MSMIDVSVYQGSIDWAKVRAAGVDQVIIRCGIGQSKIDTNFVRNIEGALANGLKVGVYQYSYASSEAGGRNEARNIARAIAPYKDKLYFPVFIDLEEKITGSNSKKVLSGFCKEINALGYNAGIYCSEGWRNSYLKGVNADYWWIAKWGSKQPSNCCLWQYSESGKVNGINTVVDLDKNISYNPAPTPEPKGDYVMIEMQVLIPYKSVGGDVRTAQRILRELGYKDQNGKLIEVDGDYGKKSVYCMKNFQKGSGNKVELDGTVKEETWNHLLH